MKLKWIFVVGVVFLAAQASAGEAATKKTQDDPATAKAAPQVELKEKQAEAARRAAEENQKAGAAFLEENKGRDGVVTLPSGLQYKILTAGSGRTPTDSDTVTCHYRGTLIDGTEFYNSYSRGRAATFTLRRGIIDGWREALKLMPEGSKWQLFVPPKLAYGVKGTGRYVGPNATLIYELELVSIR